MAGSSSGVGKTLISCGLIFALKKSGYSVQPFKVGPDYIDPGYLSEIAKKPARNLDVWLMGKKGVMEGFVENSTSDISVVEGVMGYFDGSSGESNHSSTHHVASIIKSPVILILDAAKTSRSIAATALGFKKFHRDSRIEGIILNRLGSKRHENLCRQALEPLKIPVIGCIPKDNTLSLESRHLGLIPALEKSQRKLADAAKKISAHIDMEKLIQICKNAKELPKVNTRHAKKPKVTIGVALDSSFNFYYQSNLENLQYQGAKIKFFSPMYDSKLPKCDGLYIGGGFPEIQGKALSKNITIKNSVKKFAEDQRPVYGECGGLMYLTNSIRYGSKNHKMVGLFDGQTHMTKMKLGYTAINTRLDCIIAGKSKKFHGHEFHYSEIKSLASDSKFAYELVTGQGIKDKKDGLTIYNTLASYGHLYFDSNNAKKFIECCISSSRR